MNEIVKAPTHRRWSLAELDRLSALGFFGEHEHIELVGWELITMAPKGIRHERIRSVVASWLARRLPQGVELYQELGWRPGNGHYLEPDIVLAGCERLPPDIPPASIRLIIEIAKSSLAYDQGLKADTYASLGVADYWVVNAVTLETRVHRQPIAGGYASIRDAASTEQLTPLFVRELCLRLADIDFGTVAVADDDP
ncbi:MAG: Uma2 family endonuclease [Hyphomicrobiaceae bacterium]|nr:Uma2 family endonuclease [Hyphomicrobiaceae bacterium]